jgi:superfamily II DNA or RNA helicase
MPSPPGLALTRVLARDVPGGSRVKGREYFLKGAVTRIDGTAWSVDALVRGSQTYAVTIRRKGLRFSAACTCPYFHDRFDICKHIWAVLIAAEHQRLLAGDGDVPDRATLDPFDVDAESDPEFAKEVPLKRKDRDSPPSPRPWETFLGEFDRSLAEASAAQPPPRFAGSQFVYVIDRAATLSGQGLALDLHARHRKKNGEWGKPKPVAISAREVGQLPNALDRDILPLLLGAADLVGVGYAPALSRAAFRLVGPIVERVLPLVARSGRAFLRVRPQPADDLVALVWDEGLPWSFRLEIVHPAGDESFSIDGALARGDERLAIRQPWMVLDGYIFHGGSVARLDARGAFAWLTQLRRSGPVVIPPDATGQLVDILARSGVDPTDLPEELQFEIAVASPCACVSIRPAARRVAEPLLEALVTFDYGGMRVEPGSGSTAFDRDRRRLIRRDPVFEQTSLTRLSQLGFFRQWDYSFSRQTLAIAADRFSLTVRILVREGWRVEAEGRAFRSAQAIHSEVRSGIDWFELHTAVDFGDGRVIPLPRLLSALRQGHTTVTLDDGTVGMLPEEWLQRWAGIASLGEVSGDHVRFKVSQAALLDAALASQPATRVDERFARARDALGSFEGVAPLDVAASFVGQLRDYQREALGWFEFLRRFGMGGCLADDMGLGKTVMVLAWLDRLRAAGEVTGPSLVVVPRSVVFNWREEAARFAPALRVLDFSGSSRSVEHLDGHDLVLTTYGTLRRDAVRLKDVEFEYVILDEAQTIKNAATAGAKAARLLSAKHRLALSGTPVENHLGELWSLIEFLNPGLLGTSSAFAKHGAAAARRDPEAVTTLSRGLRPFILRRTKAQVAPELPPRTELTLHCELQGVQRELYDELRDHYRTSLLGRIARDGFNKSRMHVLEALLRLRQAACHTGLIDERQAGAGSAKFDALLPLLAEVREEGHKALVFSQFTSLLALLRTRLDAEQVPYEYLDGQTRDRHARVERFHTDPACGLFLISLKAGGLGLNLAAAEYVFLLDPWWNPAVEAQAIDRAHRIGQTRHVFAYRLIASDTVEEKIAELQRSKRDLADAILLADAALIRNLKREDLEVLLS